MRAIWLVVLSLLVASDAFAQGTTKARVTYPAPTTELTIPATLLMPAGSGPVPAVVIAHGSGGVDGRGDYHAQALNRAGIATLEIDMWAPRGLKGGRRVGRGGSPKPSRTSTAR